MSSFTAFHRHTCCDCVTGCGNDKILRQEKKTKHCESTFPWVSWRMTTESNDLHGMVPDSNETVLLLIDVINHLDFEGNEGWSVPEKWRVGWIEDFTFVELLKVAEKIGKRIAALKEAAQHAGIPVVYVNDNFGKWKSDFHNVIEYVINENKPGKALAELLQPMEDDCRFSLHSPSYLHSITLQISFWSRSIRLSTVLHWIFSSIIWIRKRSFSLALPETSVFSSPPTMPTWETTTWSFPVIVSVRIPKR